MTSLEPTAPALIDATARLEAARLEAARLETARLGAARDAATLDALAQALDHAAAVTSARAHPARDDWLGCSRHWFDDSLDALVRSLRGAARATAADAAQLRRSTEPAP
ncbi:MAG: hypothetical protein JWM89_3351 [Acidimicrobiales bacterium]|nr:hypothetical protein [Acidimicrobiales bacterium]